MSSSPADLTVRPVTLIAPRSPSFTHYLDPVSFVRHLWRHRDLIRQFTRREVEGRYRGSFLGLFWSFLHPLALLAIYTFLSGVVFRARWPGSTSGGLGEFALLLFCGLVAFNVLAECVNRASGLILAVPSYVKKVVFPLEVLPVALLGSALFHALASLAVLLAFGFLARGSLSWTVALVPLAMVPLVFLTLGLTWVLASLGVFLRDLGSATPLLVQVLFFATPVIYPLESVPEPLRGALHLNPMTWVVEAFRRLIFRGEVLNWVVLAAWALATGAFMLLGYAWFMKSKKGFADVM
jgi:homopolymeric O-antigen transport system permease protein